VSADMLLHRNGESLCGPRFDDQVLRSSCASWFLVVACLLLEQVGEQGRSTGGAVGGD
jgi:hypothetical protein